MARVTVLKGLPRAPRDLTGSGALPSLENLNNKSPEELVRTLNRFGLEPDLAYLQKKATKAFDILEEVLREGGEPDAETWARIDAQIENEMTGFLRQQTKAAIRNYRRGKLAKSGAKRFTWIALCDDATCKSCLKRHGKTKTMAQWQAQGLPGSSLLVCGKECRCDLHPDDVLRETSKPGNEINN